MKLFYYGQEIQRELKVLLEKKKNITVSGSLSFILIHSLGLNILNLNLCVTLLSMYDYRLTAESWCLAPTRARS